MGSSHDGNRHAFATLLFALAVLTIATPVWSQDTVTLRRKTAQGSKLVGKVTAANRNAIKFNYRGKDQVIPAHEITRMALAGEPSGLARVRAAIVAGKDEEALELLKDISISDSARDVVRQEVTYYRCLAMANVALKGGGSVSKAGNAIVGFLKRERNNTIYHFAAAELLGDLSVAAGKFEDAARYYSLLEKATAKELKLRSLILQGDVWRAKGDWKAAADKYRTASDQPATNAGVRRQQLFAQIGLATCEGVQGKADEAVESLEQMIANQPASDSELFARVYLALGIVHQKEDRSMDAVLEFLHIDLLFPQERDAHAQALYHLVQLWPKVNQPARGVAARKTLKERYAGTHWANLIQ